MIQRFLQESIRFIKNTISHFLRWLLYKCETQSVASSVKKLGNGYIVSSSLSLQARLRLGRTFRPFSIEKITSIYQEILEQYGVLVGESNKWIWLPEDFEKDIQTLNPINCPLKSKALLACCKWIKNVHRNV